MNASDIMDGVTVLNSTTLTHTADRYFTMFIVCCLIVIALIVLSASISSEFDVPEGAVAIITIISAIVACAITIHIFMPDEAYVKEHTEIIYEVTVDDTVSMNEFFNRYEVVEQRGKIYKIKAKEK